MNEKEIIEIVKKGNERLLSILKKFDINVNDLKPNPTFEDVINKNLTIEKFLQLNKDKLLLIRNTKDEILEVYNKADWLGIEYYNLDTSNIKDLDMFIYLCSDLEQKYFPHLLFNYVLMDFKKFFRGIKGKRKFIINDQLIFRKITDKILANEPLSDKEIKHIQDRTTQIIKQYIGQDKEYFFDLYLPEDPKSKVLKDRFHILIPEYDYILSEGLHLVYDWLIQVTERTTYKIQRCQLKGCNKIFEQTPGGHPQKYCSNAHKMKAYRERKNELIAV